LGYIDASNDLIPKELKIVIEWCEKSAGALAKTVQKRALTAKSNKWKRVQALMEDAYGSPS
jgi:hypothetical protein